MAAPGPLTVALFACPHCSEQVTGEVTVKVTAGATKVDATPGELAKFEASVEPTGMRVVHDCRPKAKRSASRPTGKGSSTAPTA